jgi:hypothetical protein
MKPEKVKAEDCVNGNCEICEAAGYGLDHRLMNAFTSGGLPGVVKEIQQRKEVKEKK